MVNAISNLEKIKSNFHDFTVCKNFRNRIVSLFAQQIVMFDYYRCIYLFSKNESNKINVLDGKPIDDHVRSNTNDCNLVSSA